MKLRAPMIAVASVGALAAIGYAVYALGMKQGMLMSGASVTAAEPAGTTANAASSTEKKVLYWHDPMVPGPRFDKPGKSPFMDMQLVPVYADAGGNDAGREHQPTRAAEPGGGAPAKW